ncbi:hypothetical protein [Geodermatophilus obscurus]|uniref:hypothetical protein n=1 Tax=Geodermatophilus obscurus TaxID=1861 RepID=UPI0009334FDF|nr:hypothetical protein [Geodermatophilus obscurus]
MQQVLWQAQPGFSRRTATVRGAGDLGVPATVDIMAAVSDQDDLRGQASYIQLSVPGVGPALAWVGVPGGGQRDGRFVHPLSGETWPWGQLHCAVRFTIDYARDGGRAAGN